MLLKQSPKAALEEAQLRLQKSLDRYWEIQRKRRAGTM
jgi:hypothetical protein